MEIDWEENFTKRIGANCEIQIKRFTIEITKINVLRI